VNPAPTKSSLIGATISSGYITIYCLLLFCKVK
ncbi:MAG: hypothetical protein ACI9E3_000229, partial [Flavobacteriales bacterium]